EYRAQFALFGTHFAAPDAVKFTQLRVRYTDLEFWSGTTGVKLEASDPRDFVAHVKVPESVVAGTWEKWDIALEFEHETSYPSPGQPFEVREAAWFSLSS